MASNQTPHLQLCQWEKDDEVLRIDFNADNAKIDTAVAGVEQKLGTSVTALEEKIQAAQVQAIQAAQMVENKVLAETARAKTAEASLTGAVSDLVVYSGNCIVVSGTYIGTGTGISKLTFPYKPMLVLLEEDFLLRQGVETSITPFGVEVRRLMITWEGNSVSWYAYNGGTQSQCNIADKTYHYVAFLARTEDDNLGQYTAS